MQTDVLGDIMFIVILRYASYSAAVQWHESEEREEWLLKLAEINLKSDPIQANINFVVLPVVEVGNIGVDVSGAAVAPMSRFWFWFSIWMQVYLLVEFFEWLLPKLLDFGERAKLERALMKTRILEMNPRKCYRRLHQLLN